LLPTAATYRRAQIANTLGEPPELGAAPKACFPRQGFEGISLKRRGGLMAYRFDPHQCLKSGIGLDSSNSPKRLFLCPEAQFQNSRGQRGASIAQRVSG
jgi:hypothetical protein